MAIDSNWREAYRRRAEYQSAAIEIEDNKAKARSAQSKSADLANAAFRNSLKSGPVTLNSADAADDELDERVKKGGWDGFLASGEKALNTPVAQGIIDALSIGTYTSAATANTFVESARAAKDNPDNPVGAYLGEGLDQLINHNPVVMGVKAAFGDDDSTRTYADVIKNATSVAGGDTENDAAKWGQGLGGLAGDIFLDPLTYATFGAAPFIKGAVGGFREGGKVAKATAQEAVRLAESKGASLAGSDVARIAENSSGRVGSAIEGGKQSYSKWMETRATEKANRKAIRAERTDSAGTIDTSVARIGNDVDEVEAGIQARRSANDEANNAAAFAETQRKAAEAEARFAEVTAKSGDEHLQEAISAVTEAPIPKIVDPVKVVEKPGPAPKEGQAAKEELNKTTVEAEIKNVEESAPIAPPKPTPAEKMAYDLNGAVFDKYEPLWQTSKYSRPDVKKAFAEPATLRQQVARTDWDAVYADIKANPNKMVSITTAEGKVVKQKGSSLVKNIETNYGGDASQLLPNMGLAEAHTKAHTSTMRKVPLERVNGVMVRNAPLAPKKEGFGKAAGLKADSRQAKAEQKERGKTIVKEKDFGPQQADFAQDYLDDGIFFAASDLRNAESGFDLDGFIKYAEENPNEILKLDDVKSGVSADKTMEQFVDMVNNYHAGSEGFAKTIDKYLKANVLFFTRFDKALEDAEEIAVFEKKMADYTKAVDDWKASKEAPKAEEIADTPEEISDVLDEYIHPDYELVPNYEDVPNPNAWNAEKAKQYGIDEEHLNLTPQELALIQKPMDATQIRRFITSKNERGITKGQLDELRKLTGKTDPEEVATAFIGMRKLYNAGKKKSEAPPKPKKAVKETRVDEVTKVMDEAPSEPIPAKATTEEIEAIQVENAKVAEEIAGSPVALDELAQKQFRIDDYERAIQRPLDPSLSGIIEKGHVLDAAREAVKASILYQTKTGKFKTDTGFFTQTEDIATGNAWRPDRWGSDSQIALHSSIWSYVNKLKAPPGGWTPHIRAKAYMAIMDIADKELRAMGIEPFLNHAVVGVGAKGVQHSANLSYYDILKALDRKGFAKHLNMLIDGQRAFIPTQVQGAAEIIIRLRASGVDEKIIRQKAIQQLIGGKVRATKPGETMYRTEAHGRPASNAEKADNITRGKVNAIANGSGKYPGKGQMEAIRVRVNDARAVADALMDPDTYRALNTQMMVNHAAHASALGKNVDDLVTKTVERVKGLADAGHTGDVLGFLRGELRSLSTKFPEADFKTANGLFRYRMAEHMSEAERQSVIQATARADAIAPPAKVVEKNIEASSAVVTAGKNVGKPAHSLYMHDQPSLPPTQNLVNKSHAKEVQAAEDQARAMAPEGAEEFEIIGAAIAADAMRKIHPLQKYVNPRLGLTDNVYRAINSGLHSVARQQSEFHGSLLTHLSKYGDQALLDDFRELQELAKAHGKLSKDNPFTIPDSASDSMRELFGITTVMFDKSTYNVFARNGVGANHFNSLAKANGLHDKWRFGVENDAYTNSTLWMNWEGIEEKGVLDFLSRMHSIAVKASQDIAIAASFTKNFGKAAPEPGHVKITWNNRNKRDMENTVFYDLLDKDLYYPKDVAMQVAQIDKLLTESRHIDPKGPVSKFIVNVFDPITNALKASQTTVRPGHWTISFAGDLLRNQIAGVNSYTPYKHAAKIMMQGKKMLEGEGDDFLNKIASAKDIKKYGISQEINQGYMGSSAGKGVTLFVGGKKVNINYETMNKLLRDVVMLPKHRGGGVLEDRFIENNPTSSFAKTLEKGTDFVTDNSKFSLNEWAARRDNLMRISLAVDYASKRKWKNLQDMKDGMEEYVTKWAPTSTDFTSFESKYARRSLLYYTWLRGITPRIIDSAMTKPGVTTMVPKALYNMAYANGLNPESIGDPFPDNMLVPSYYGNNVLGPQWKNDFGTWGINPSSPVIEVGNTFARFKPGDPIGNIGGGLSQLGGMATPFVRMPAELATGHQAGTGMLIEDQGQYIADNLGGSYFSALSRATGKTAGLNGIVDRTDSAAKYSEEDQAEHAKLQLINFLSGLKLTDYQSNSAIKAGAYDIAEKYSKAAEMQERAR